MEEHLSALLTTQNISLGVLSTFSFNRIKRWMGFKHAEKKVDNLYVPKNVLIISFPKILITYRFFRDVS